MVRQARAVAAPAPPSRNGAKAATRSRKERAALYAAYADKLRVNYDLSRAIVSFQASRVVPFHRWFSYREAFSPALVEIFLEQFRHSASRRRRRVLDPFAGVGTTLITSARSGWRATGIELLPVGVAAIRARLCAETVEPEIFERALARLAESNITPSSPGGRYFPHLAITKGAFRARTERAFASYKEFLETIREPGVRYLFWFAWLSVLEEVSFTRKDGQYLRWDVRSRRQLRSNFRKPTISDFRPAVERKLRTMLADILARAGSRLKGKVGIIEGSCLTELPKLRDASVDLVVTSPPYCNRYDYTRTYALELAALGYDEQGVKDLRQTLLSATVENKSKQGELAAQYREHGREAFYEAAVGAFSGQAALHEVLGLLYKARDEGTLNNNNIPSMVENYFFEMNLVIRELARLVAPGGMVVMVNDNVRYHGEEVPVDLILSDFASAAGLTVDAIWILPKGKGNSSQQMRAHGRSELRKCVYVWTKP